LISRIKLQFPKLTRSVKPVPYQVEGKAVGVFSNISLAQNSITKTIK
jgi:hypothetical protein